MTGEIQDFRDIVLSIHKDGVRYLNELQTSEVPAVCNGINWFADERQLSRLLNKSKGDLGNYVVAVRGPTGMNKPIVGLWTQWDFEADLPWCKLELIMCRAPKQIYGFRIDPPHDFEKHDYWHAQFTHAFSNSYTRFPTTTAVDWISKTTPAYPITLDSHESITPQLIAVYSLLSLYGKDWPGAGLLQRVKAVQTLTNPLRKFLSTISVSTSP